MVQDAVTLLLLSWSPGQEVQVQDLASPVPNVIYQQNL